MEKKKEQTVFFALIGKYEEKENLITKEVNVEMTGYKILPCVLIKNCSGVDSINHKYISKYLVCFWNHKTNEYENSQYVSEIFDNVEDAQDALIQALMISKTEEMFLKYENGDLKQPEHGEIPLRTLTLVKSFKKGMDEKRNFA